ncbi:MAG: hypothetical protein O3A25_08325, partial [Acidobacteria bacterium]|nr:hypothetical protein [Acidobacteriota bacterium]
MTQESASAGPAGQLRSALEAAQLDSIAAKDSEGDDRFVAALFFLGSSHEWMHAEKSCRLKNMSLIRYLGVAKQ